MFPKVIFGTSCLGNLYKDIGYEAKKEIIQEIIRILGTFFLIYLAYVVLP